MRDTRVLVTGPTAGIGKAIAVALGAMGARLVLACRDLDRGRQAAADIASTTGATDVDVMLLDTSDQRSIRAFTEEYAGRHRRLDVLVNNAGLAQGERRLSPDGIELTFATNVLGYHLLTRGLLDVLTRSGPSRIVNVASRFAGHLDLDDLQFTQRPFDGLQAYAQSKACNRMLSWALARRLEGTGVTVNAYAPGFVAGTGLSRDLPPAIRAAYRERPGRSVEEGADTAVWLASSPDVAGVTNSYFMDRQPLPCEFRNELAEETLWRTCEGLIRPAG
jgi:NAD(P)-dependent dehydrogenase (short-subunit alcohol dehydrogenase family)